MAPEILRIRNLTFSYDGGRPILNGLNLELGEGEILSVMGRSGSGKTTLLKLIAGLLYPYDGEITLKILKNRLGYVPQQIGLVSNLTALQNVLLGSLGRPGGYGRILGIFPEEEVEKAYKLLNELGISELADRKAALLSGGERQRVAVGRALMQEPQLLLADEFVSDLDVFNAMEVMKITRDLCRRKNVSVIMTMHDAFLVKGFSDRVAVIGNGRVIRDFPASQLDTESLSKLLVGDAVV
ncbi:Phosphate-import ATP-binding protein PhnC [archaeon HR01]|nr:Phosphate-import ATP-binding protein PhnC [archaeon HR01]